MGRLLASLALFASVPALCDGAAKKNPCPKCAWAWATASAETTTALDLKTQAIWAWETVTLKPDIPKPLPKPAPKPSRASGWHFPRVGEVSAPFSHWHVCACGRVLSHGDEFQGDVAAHTCVCGRVNFDKVPGTPVNRIAAYCPTCPQ